MAGSLYGLGTNDIKMIIKDLTFAFRNLRRNKLLAAINVLGLSIGISACLVIFLIANYEMSFDRFQPEKDRIYRVYSSFSGVFSGLNRGIPTAVPVAVRDNFSGVESVTNFHTFSGQVDIPDDKGIRKDFGNYEKIIIADPEYFEVFSYYQWVEGNPIQSLSEPFKVVISESRAKTYFGDLNPLDIIGREIHYRDSLVVTVSGIVKDITERTDLDFTDFISFGTIEKSWLNENNIQLNNWSSTNSSSQLFIKLALGTTADKIEVQIPKLAYTYKENNKSPQWNNTPKLQPLGDLHFNYEIGIFDNSRSVAGKSTLQILVVVAALLLTIACINFINLQTAQASRRAKEVGVRKVLGSSRRKLIVQFLVESFILCVLAVILSVVIADFSLQFFSDSIPQGLVFDITDPIIAIFLISCIIVVTLLAGLYPAFVLSSYQPALALKNLAHSNTATSRSAFIRKGLTIFQFSFSQILIIGTIAIGLQLDYMLNKDLGFSSDAVVFVRTPWWEKMEKRLTFKNELEQIPEIETLSTHGAPPSSANSASGVMAFDNGKEVLSHNVYMKHGDTSYIRVYDIKLLAGRNLLPIDTAHEYLINEKYMHLLGFTEPRDVLGKTVNEKATIAGVVKDFHTQSLHAEITPTIISYRANDDGFGIKLATPRNKFADMKPALGKIETAWKKIYPDEKFEYSFMNDTIKKFYETEQRIGKLARIATGIAILISCLGLFGLSSFTVIQRTKEIGIRKVLGATVNSILFLLSKDFLKLVVIAFIISAPIAYYVAGWWLKDFAYRVDITAWIFVASGSASIIIALITISFRTVSAAKSDPVKSLRYE